MSMRHQTTVIIAASVCVGLFLSGCGESVDYPETVPVTGQVTLDGEPIENASIVLRPVGDPAESYPARATSGADGTFTVHTFFSASHDVEGAVPGKYQVSVIKYEQQESAPPSPDAHGASGSSTDEAMKQAYLKGARRGRSAGGGAHSAQGGAGASAMAGLGGNNVLPRRYADPATSELEAEIKSDQENNLVLDLKSS